MTDLAQLAHLAHPPTAALNGLLLFTLGWAVVTDLRSRRISNRLTYPVAALGLAIHAATGGWGGLATSGLGLLLGSVCCCCPSTWAPWAAGTSSCWRRSAPCRGPSSCS